MKFVSGYTGHVQGAQEDCGRSVVDFARWSSSTSAPHFVPYTVVRKHAVIEPLDALNVPYVCPPSPYQHLSAFHLPGNPLLHPHGKSLRSPVRNPFVLSTGDPIPYTALRSSSSTSPYIQPTRMASPGYSHIMRPAAVQSSNGNEMRPYNECVMMSRGGDPPQRTLVAPLGLLTLPPSPPPVFASPQAARYVP